MLNKKNFQEITYDYDAFILDLWGVIHDGQQLYSGAKDCLDYLHAKGKKIVLLSNAPRRAASVSAVMQGMGVMETDYDALITSGETAYNYLADPTSPVFRPNGGGYVYAGLEKDRGILEGLPYYETDDAKDAQFLLLSHSFYDNQPKAELAPLFERCVAAKLPALCINPDTEVVRQNGGRVYCAGELAAEYAQQGGQVTYFGKPHPLVYEASFNALKDVPRSRILAVGDNPATDILGANANGIKSALVTGGVLKTGLGDPSSGDYPARLDALLAEANAVPDYVLPAFNW